MKKQALRRFTVLSFLLMIVSALALLCPRPPSRVTAQEADSKGDSTEARSEERAPRRYILKDLGTFGGPSSGLGFFAKVLNNRGTVVGDADTSTPDPFAPNCLSPSCFVSHGFKWEHGIKTDLGTLPGGSSSDVNFVSERGQITGRSQNGLIDPLTSGIPETVAVLWQANGEIINLGTLGGNQGLAVGVNNSGQVVGMSTNTIPDAFSFFDPRFSTQTRAFLWQRGVMRDLGTLGGPDAFAAYVNERGQVAGSSYTNSTPNDTTGIPTVHPFLWENGRMRDLGSLGGTFSFPNDINSRGQVVGTMNLLGDGSFHPFFWDRGRLIDLGTFGGSNGEANWMNDAGEVVGYGYFAGNQVRHAFTWRDGVKTDLGPPPGDVCTNAFGINSEGQVVGTSGVCHGALHALLWENGSPIDLNTVIPPNSSLQLVYALSINDRGEIAGIGVPPGVPPQDYATRGHAFLLIPVEEDDAEDTTKADSRQDQQSQEVGQDDTAGPTTVRRINTVTGETVAPSTARRVNDDQTGGNRLGRFSLLPFGREK
jgi:probable HAF family extracellular repeat protein